MILGSFGWLELFVGVGLVTDGVDAWVKSNEPTAGTE